MGGGGGGITRPKEQQQTRRDHHPWRLSPLGGRLAEGVCDCFHLQSQTQLNSGGGGSHTRPPLDCLKEAAVWPRMPPSSQIHNWFFVLFFWGGGSRTVNHNGYIKATSSRVQWVCRKTGNGNPRLECINVRYPASKLAVDVLSQTSRGQRKWPSTETGEQSSYHK